MDARTARKERRHEQVREEILEAASAVLLRKGLAGMTLSAVARELELTKAALYHYFDSKEALVAELVYQSLEGHADAVGNAVEQATSGADAIEALIRTSAAHYGERKDELRLAYLMPQVAAAGSSRLDTELLTRIRPFNERIYGATARRIEDDQRAGRVPPDIDGRRLAFLAHTAVLGILTVEGLVEVADDRPLIHPRQGLVEDLAQAFRARLEPGAGSEPP